jgi:hypothetical protein
MNMGQVRHALACGQVFCTGRPQNPLGSGPAQTLFGPGGFGQRPVRVEGDCLSGDADLAGGFPVPADCGVVQPGVMAGHLGRVMIENPADHFLRHVLVDHPGSERVTPLVRGEMHRQAVLILDVAAFQPAVEGQPVGGAAGRSLPVEVLGRPGEQARRDVGPAF